MGNYWVPQKYLLGFATDSDPPSIWQYDKQIQQFSERPIPVKNVAQARRFYDPATEAQLNTLVESPANAAIDKLKNGESLSDEARVQMALYMATMLYRVPSKRALTMQMVPRIIEESVARFIRIIDQAKLGGEIDGETAAGRLAEADTVRDKFLEAPPEEVLEVVRRPWPNVEVVSLIASMNWVYLHAEGRVCFVTSDNPFFLFGCYGLGNSDSEFTFPVSKNLAIFGTWRPVSGRHVHNFRPDLVKESNRRIIANASRFVYCHERAAWVPTVASKKQSYLSKII